ncbi:MAG: SDR family NAD(P)-dependent oxidoreductase [Lachnospiraceae bacterium]|nr:SDR family NAD(P)-dependent oxidoreductase [Lachnospiraceae bacterium]
MNIAIITGASAGLGKVFFEKVTERYPALDEIWIIARREDRLKELAIKYSDRKIRVLPLDLALSQSFEMLDQVLNEQNPNIKVLINNAGFDRAGLFHKMKYTDIYSLINVNVMGMTMINRCCLPYMSKGSYEIIVGSAAAFVPLPWRAVYSATKVYGKFLARALRQEEKKMALM